MSKIRIYFQTCSLFLIATTPLLSQSPHINRRSEVGQLGSRYLQLLQEDTLIIQSTPLYRSDLTTFALHKVDYSFLRKSDIPYLEYLIQDHGEYYNTGSRAAPSKVYVDSSMLFYQYENTQETVSPYQVKERSPGLGYFVKDPAAVFQTKGKHHYIKVNPILHIQSGPSNQGRTVFQNTRGLEVRGLIDQKVSFYTSIFENQRSFVSHIDRRIRQYQAIPGQGLYKGYQSSIIESLQGYDYLNAIAYFGLPLSRHIHMELGHGNHFWGNGYHSLLLSDYGNNYFYLKLNSRVGKFQLQNIFGELAAVSHVTIPGDDLIDKKYFAAHYLSFLPRKNLEISLSETVVFSRLNNFELQYLNPIILYRVVEQFIGSPDNVILGLNTRWDPVPQLRLYGQVVVDEFNLNQFTAGTDWWGNKYGIQAGLRYLNALDISHLDVQIEYNMVRPFTYSHRTQIDIAPRFGLSSFSHYNQPLAHPLGANFREVMVLASYRPAPKWQLMGKTYYAVKGEDTADEVFGGDILRPSGDRSRDTGFQVGDGNTRTIFGLELTASYQFFHGYFIDVQGLYRSDDSDISALNDQYLQIGIRANMARHDIDY